MRILFALGLYCAALGLAQNQPSPGRSIARPLYVIAPGDNILIHAPLAEKVDGRIFQVDSTGFVSLPGRTPGIRPRGHVPSLTGTFC